MKGIFINWYDKVFDVIETVHNVGPFTFKYELNTDQNQKIMDVIYAGVIEHEKAVIKSVFLEIEAELAKHKFSTDMSGWDIVPKLTATMELLRAKFVKEEDARN